MSVEGKDSYLRKMSFGQAMRLLSQITRKYGLDDLPKHKSPQPPAIDNIDLIRPSRKNSRSRF